MLQKVELYFVFAFFNLQVCNQFDFFEGIVTLR